MDIAAQKQSLLTLRKTLAGEMHNIEHRLDAPMPKDWEDRATERQGDEVLEALGSQDETRLRLVDAALARIDDGIYGLCLRCEEPISDERLAAVPEAVLCRTCAQAGPHR